MNRRTTGWHALAVLLVQFTATAVAAPNEAELQQARDLLARAQQLYVQGSYQEAVPIASRVLEIRERQLGPKNTETAIALHQLALLKDMLGAQKEAELLYLRAITAREETLGPEHPDVADSLVQLGQIYTIIGEYAKSEMHLQRALSIYQKSRGAEDPKTAMALNALGNYYYMTESFSKAKDMYERTLSIREKSLGSEHVDTGAVLANLGNVYSITGEYDKGIQVYRRAIAIREKASGPDHPKTAHLLANAGNLYRMVGDYGQAEQVIKRALAIRERTLGPDHPLTASNLSGLAHVYQLTGAYSMAVELQRRTRAIYEKRYGIEHIDTARSIGSLASLHYLMGDYEKAEPLFLQSLSIYEKVLGPENVSVALQLANVADFYMDIRAYAKAEPAYVRALDMRQRLLGAEHPETAYILYALGELYAYMDKFEKSEKLHLQALAIRETIFIYGHPEVIESINALASLTWRKGSASKALQLFSQAQTMQTKNSERFLVASSELRRRAYLQAHNTDVFKSVSFSVLQPTREGIALGLTNVLQYKGRVLDESTDSLARLRYSLNAGNQATLEQLTDVTTRLSNLTYQTGSMSSPEYKQQLKLLQQRQETLEADLAQRSSEYRKQVMPVTVAGVSRAIPKNAVLVEWFRYIPFDPKNPSSATDGDSRYVAYVLKQGLDPAVVDIGDARTIDSLVHDFRSAVGNPKSTDAKARAAALSGKLLKPLQAHLKGFEHLVISPDGALNLVPIAALLDERGEYMAKRFNISYVTSGRDLLQINARSSSRGSAVVIADPEFGSNSSRVAQLSPSIESQRSADLDRGGLVFRPLKNTALEAQDIKTLLNLSSRNVLLNAEATESSIKQLHGPRILHIASHGFFLSDQEFTAEIKKRTAQVSEVAIGESPLLRAGIALAGANARRSGTTDDGILTALEVAQLDLHGTDLVVLSACDSGVGDVQNGEGVYGLRRALVLAGSQTQVTSLWKVSDEATRPLMADFYKRLLNGEGRSTALRHAQQQRLANAEHSHPYYWASFVPFGNWAPLPALQ